MRSFVIYFVLALALVTSASAQPFQAFVFNIETVLTTTCGGSTPIPDGTPIQIFWDNDSNGPDADDPQPPLCGVTPPDSANDVNIDPLVINGAEILGEPGKFYALDVFESCLALPVPARYYLRVCYGSMQWVCAVQVLVSGIQEWSTTGWTCINQACAGCPVPQPPSNFVASDSTCTEITLSWAYPDSVASVDSFFVYRDGALLERVQRTVGTGQSFTYHDIAAVSGNMYVYAVSARRVCGVSDWTYSTQVLDAGMRPTIPPIPNSVAATDGSYCDTVRITFQYVTNQGVDTFLIKRNGARVGAVAAQGVPGSRTFVYSGADAPTRAAYTVVGKNLPCGEGTPSASDSGHANDQPPTPQNVNATDGLCSTVTIMWNDVVGETGYQVWRANSDGSNPVLIGNTGANTTIWNDNTGVAYVVYRYWITSLNVCGSSVVSVYSNGHRTNIPAQVTGVIASDAICTHVAVNWNAQSAVDSFQVRRNSVRIGVAFGGAVSYNDSTGSTGVVYAYSVAAYNACGAGTSSIADNGIRCGVVYPGPVTGVAASDSNCTEIIVTWNPATAADGYRVFRDNVMLDSVPAPLTIYHDLSAASGTAYVYLVVAYNGWGDGPLSNTDVGIRPVGSAVPLSPKVVLTHGGEDALLFWSPVTRSVDSCAVSITRYLVFSSLSYGGPYQFHGFTGDTTYVHHGVITYSPAMYYNVIATTAPAALVEQLPVGADFNAVISRLREPGTVLLR